MKFKNIIYHNIVGIQDHKAIINKMASMSACQTNTNRKKSTGMTGITSRLG
jgi:hypothetical protein